MKVVTTKTRSNETFYICHSFVNRYGKNTSKTHKRLGTLSELSLSLNTNRDGVMAWAKEQARIATIEYQKDSESVSVSFSPNQFITKFDQNKFNCGYLFLQSLYSDLRFDNIIRNIKNRHGYDFDLNAILSNLIYARILQPSSKKSSYSFAQTLLERPKYQLHDVYRALSVLADESDYIQSDVYRNSQFLHKRNTKVLYYDCTNYYFEIEQEDGSKKYGKCKENRPNPIIGMGLFMDADGFPLAFDLYPGNQNEQKTLKPLEQKVIRDFDCSEFVYCSDSGLGSQDNKLLNDMGGRSYVITQSLKKLKKEDRDIALNPEQYRKLGSTQFIDLRTLDETDPEVYESVYYKEIPLDSKKVSETLIVTYSPKYKAYQRKIREGQIERAKNMIGDGNKVKKNRHNPNDPARFITKTSVTAYGEVADKEFCTLNEEVVDKEAMYDGFYGVATDIEGDVSEIIAINKRRWQIEECFRIMKTDFSARPVYLQREDRIKAHFLICFLSLLIYRILESKLENKYTVKQTLDTLEDMELCAIDGYGYIPAYTRTDLTDELHALFDFHTDTKISKKSKIRSIINQTKKR